MNGAITIGTLDGANIEIRDAVEHGKVFLFGMTLRRS
jgi:glycogen phosphorylase